MRRGLRVLGLLVLCLFVIPLGGCRVVLVTLRIQDFDSSEVEGVTFWRDQGGTFVVDGKLYFQGTKFVNGQEVLDYEYVTTEGRRFALAHSILQRDPTNPDDVTVQLYYVLLDHPSGTYKVSAFNAVGESPLSIQSTTF